MAGDEQAKKEAHPGKVRRSAIAPEKSFRERFLHKLPHYTGPYNVGYMDIEVPVRQPRPVSNLKRNGKPVLRLDTVLMGIYYPADIRKTVKEEGQENLHRVPWMPRPRLPTAAGYAKFLGLPEWPFTAYMACTSLYTKLPAFRNTKLADHWPEEMMKEQGPSGDQAREDADRHQKPKFPVVIFTHGLGGSRLCYSGICGELASFGFIVVAVEHRDGSGARTYVSLPNDKVASAVESSTAEIHFSESTEDVKKDKKVRRRTRHGRKAQDLNPYYIMDYIIPQDNAQDTAPSNPRGVDTKLRCAQIDLRMEEIKEAFYILELINSGKGEEVAAKNLRKKGNIGSSSMGLIGINWNEWKDRMFLENVTIMGHSFGGATTVQLCRDESLTWLGQGVALDPWGQGIPEAGEKKVNKPIMSISSEAFMHWKSNFDRVVEFCQEARESDQLCWMLTIVGSTHLAQSDFAVLYPHWLALFMKSMVHPLRAFYLTLSASLEFLNVTLPPEQTKYNVWVNEKLLHTKEPSSDPEDALKDDHAPDDKWVALRLKIDGEYRVRFKAAAIRFWRVMSCRKVEDEVNLGAGLTDFGEEDELWTHLSPPRHLLDHHLFRVSTSKSLQQHQ